MLAALVLVVITGLRTDWGRARVASWLAAQAEPYIDGQLRIGRLDGSLWSGARLRDVAVVRDGHVVLTIAEVNAGFDVRSFLTTRVVLDRVTLVAPVVTVIETASGWYVDGLELPDAPPDAPASSTSLEVGAFAIVDGRAEIRQLSRRYDLVRLHAGGTVRVADVVRVQLDRLTTHEAVGDLPILSAATTIVVDDAATTLSPFAAVTPGSRIAGPIVWTADGQLRAELSSEQFDLREFAPYAPAAEGLELRPTFDGLRLEGPLEALRVQGTLREPAAGDMTVDLVTDVAGVFAARGRADLQRVDASRLRVEPMPVTSLDGHVTFDVRDNGAGVTVGTFTADLSRVAYDEYRLTALRASGAIGDAGGRAEFTAAAYGARSTGVATWSHTSDRIVTEGQAAAVNLEALPAFMALPRLTSSFEGRYRVELEGERWALDATLAPSAIEGASVASGGRVTMASDGETLLYEAAGIFTALDPKRLTTRVLEEPVDWPVTAVRMSGPMAVKGRGPLSSPVDHTLTFEGRVDMTLDGAEVRQAAVSGGLANRRLTLAADGALAGRWEQLAQMSARGALVLDGRARLSMAVPDVMAELSPSWADGTLSVALARSEVFDITVDELIADVSTTGGVVTIARASAASTAGRATAQGRVGLAQGATHDLSLAVTVADLRALPDAWGMAAAGQVQFDGVLAGTVEVPVVKGRWSASSVEASGVSALLAGGDVDVQMPDRDTTRMTGSATFEASEVEAGGQRWPVVTGRATFAGATTGVDMTARHAWATIAFAGDVSAPAPGETLIRPRRATVSVAGADWRLVESPDARLTLTADHFTVTPIALVRGDERIALEGTLPATDGASGVESPLRLTMSGVAVGPFVTAVAGAERMTGRLDGRAVVTGSMAAPRTSATFAVRDGTADGVPLRSLEGQVEMAGGLASLSVDLDAGERGRAAVRGRAPVDASADGLDLTITAALTDVGVIAPAVPYIADAAGALSADLRITGTRHAAIINGTAGATALRFSVPETGVEYRDLNATVRVRESVLEVEQFSVADQAGRRLTAAGRLDVVALDRSGEVDLRIRANDFTLLANAFGEVAVDVDLTAVGTVFSPQIIGRVSVVRGRFEVDRLLEEFAVGPVTPVSTPAATPVAQAHAAPAPPSVYGGAAMSIDLQLPDNVIVRGRGLQTDEGPVGLGDINLTIGGTLQVTKVAGGQPALTGEVAAVRGTYEFQGRRFQIERGSRLRFRGDDYTNPALDITAVREVSGVTVTARLGGTAAEPSLTLSSEPALDQGDILALIVFNRPINELGDEQRVSLAARAGTLAATAVAGPIADSVARALDLDVLEIRPAEPGGTGPVVEVGRQVSDRLYVGFRHEFGATGANRVSLEYRLTEFLRILTSVAPGADPDTLRGRADTAGIDLVLVIRRD